MQPSTYKVRLSMLRREDDSDRVLELLNALSPTCYVLCWEYQNTKSERKRPHAHLYLEFEKSPNMKDIREKLRTYIGKGNSAYSIKAMDYVDENIQYIAYMLKEGMYTHNLENSRYQKCKEYNEKVKLQLKEKKSTKKTVLEQIEEKYFSNVVDGVYVDKDLFVTPENTIRNVIEFYKETGTLIREFQIISIVQTLLLKYCQFYSDKLFDRILEKIN